MLSMESVIPLPIRGRWVFYSQDKKFAQLRPLMRSAGTLTEVWKHRHFIWKHTKGTVSVMDWIMKNYFAFVNYFRIRKQIVQPSFQQQWVFICLFFMSALPPNTYSLKTWYPPSLNLHLSLFFIGTLNRNNPMKGNLQKLKSKSKY